MTKPTIPKGTRDFLPQTMAKRTYIFDSIEKIFKNHGFLAIETPSFENSNTLMGKYGEEGDRLIFKILDSGDFLKKVTSEDLALKKTVKIASKISEKALRYDLTVPFARFVVQNQNELTFPFKRYQIQPVWRADRPQKGRYREFYQCDVDIVGSDSLWNEIELIQIFDEVLTQLQIPNFTIKLNNRKILTGIAEVIGEKDKIIDITVAIDKLDKIGIEKVKEELRTKKIKEEAIDKLTPLLTINGDNKGILSAVTEIIKSSKIGMKGIIELQFILDKINLMGLNKAKIAFTPSLARGLNYYTGAIFEVVVDGLQIGSICGGGRYDDLTGIFGMKNLSGVGISFGADRIYDVLEELALFPTKIAVTTQIMFVNFGDKEAAYSLNLISNLRKNNIATELYPDSTKMKKQMTYANNKNIPYVALVGTKEMESNLILVKNMQTGGQKEYKLQELINLF